MSVTNSSSGTFMLTPTKCDRTEGLLGETIADYPTYPALVNNNRFIPLPF